MHKLHDDDKFYMGIIWDFDWGLGFNRRPKSPSHYNIFPTQGTVLAGYKKGGKFFGRIMRDPVVKSAFKERWATFRNELYDDLKDEVRAYGNRISTAVKNDHLIWGSRGATGDTEKNVKKALTWLDARAEWLDSYVADW